MEQCQGVGESLTIQLYKENGNALQWEIERFEALRTWHEDLREGILRKTEACRGG